MKSNKKNTDMKNKTSKQTKTQVFNVIILDKSGSMGSIRQAAVDGFNETLAGIKKAQERYADTQDHFVSLLTFCSCENKYVFDKVPVKETRMLTREDYQPCCCTPLYDAMGFTLTSMRNHVTAIEDTATIEEAADLFRDTWFSRIPVYHEDLDHIVGILNEKDFYKKTHEGCTEITKIMKEPVFAPASLAISNLLKLFRTSKTHLVILLDEFGGTDGIVTMEDVLEELVGEIYDEHDEISEEVVEQEDGSLIVDGSMQLEELMEKFGLENTYDADTVGGWAGEMLEKVPEVGDSFTLRGYQFTVMEMDGFRVTRMQVAKLPPEEPEEAAGEEKSETEPEAEALEEDKETKH